MSLRRRRGTRATSLCRSIYIVSSGQDVEQVFATREDAERFAGENPGVRVSRHQVRESVDDAVVVFDRRVVVSQGTTVLDRTDVVRCFVDDPHDTPVPADVEWFHDERDSGWHIAGFGVDKAALDAKMQNAIDRVSRLSHASPLEGAQ